MKLAIYGHASTQILLHTKNGRYLETYMPGGAALIHAMQTAQPKIGLAVMETLAFPLERQVDHSADFRKEYMKLRRFEIAGRGKYYAISQYMGFREGLEETSIAYYPPHEGDTQTDLIVWDEGWGGLEVPVHGGKVLWASNKALPLPEQFDKVKDRCFLFLDADILRTAGAMITSQISWERSASQLIWQLRNNEKFRYLLEAPHLFITFGEDGAVYIDRTENRMKAYLLLTSGDAEGTLRENVPGIFHHTFGVMTAALGHIFTEFMNGSLKADYLRNILEIGEGFMRSGYKVDTNFESIELQVKATAKDWPMFPIPILDDPQDCLACVKKGWTIADYLSDKFISDIAFEYVMKGTEVIDGLPQISFGALRTIDRWEIEAYQNIRKLIVDYVNNDQIRPLSIAVFGSPGSGKSFGVSQIAQNVFPGRIEQIGFNVSQFTSASDLSHAFQLVRDTILRGKLPLVFFDEFDSDRDGIALGWIKSFLMPMQDGKFKGENGDHPIGKCILVFAGGTAASFDEFVRPMEGDDSVERERFKGIKGPDFVSRLRGTLSLFGPNQRGETDKNYILRRALLLRGMLEGKFDYKKNPYPVSENIIRAMLQVPLFKHGARSMEAIIDMSRIENNKWEPSFLPSISQLALHVDADAFLELLL